MIRLRRLTAGLLDAWLIDQQLANGHPRYRLRLWRDAANALPALREELRAYIDEAFDDARRRLRTGFEDALSPFNDPALDPAANFPAALNRIDSQYCEHGGSKAKRLCVFLRASSPQLTARVLQGLLEHRLQSSSDDLPEDELKRYKTTIDRLARESSTVNTVSEVTRRAIFDEWRKPGRCWAGRLGVIVLLVAHPTPRTVRSGSQLS
jgi:hypothetical protein